jgi:hypothetical protein
VATPHLLGMAKVKCKVKILLHIDGGAEQTSSAATQVAS